MSQYTKIFVFLLCGVYSHIVAQNSGFDVLNYHLKIEPNIQEKSIKGEVDILFSVDDATQQIALDCGSLIVDTVKGQAVAAFHQQKNQLVIQLKEMLPKENSILITYQGAPKIGIHFLPDKNQVYTVFSTSEWMVCRNLITDKASISTDVIVDGNLNAIACGELFERKKLDNGKMCYCWVQNNEVPAYTFGFAIGVFNHTIIKHKETLLNCYSASHTIAQLDTIFQYTADMIEFFESKTGVYYQNKSYNQILIGNHYQEMAGFAVLKETYGDMILKDSTETNLVSHEMAHQWWGNSITCERWGEFWLNESFATFMSAAYNEHRIGREKYLKDINSYRDVYEKVKKEGNDKALVFRNWNNPSSSDRSIVYFKGAYVLHLMREELGDAAFWEGVKHYSKKYFGKSVNAKLFQQAMEEATKTDLQPFFDEWVY